MDLSELSFADPARCVHRPESRSVFPSEIPVRIPGIMCHRMSSCSCCGQNPRHLMIMCRVGSGSPQLLAAYPPVLIRVGLSSCPGTQMTPPGMNPGGMKRPGISARSAVFITRLVRHAPSCIVKVQLFSHKKRTGAGCMRLSWFRGRTQ